MSNIKQKMDKLAQDSDTIIASPETLEQLREQGIPFDEVPAQTLQELFDERLNKAVEVLQQLPPLPDPADLEPAVRSLYQEIRECIVFGLNGAAITLASILVEFITKQATFVVEIGGFNNYDPDKWAEFEEIQLAQAINRAKSAGILDSKMAKRLHDFRNTIRNPYNHYNIRQITSDVIARKVIILNTKTGEVEERDIEAVSDRLIQSQAKPLVDRKSVLPVFYFADEVLRYFLEKLKEHFGSTKAPDSVNLTEEDQEDGGS